MDTVPPDACSFHHCGYIRPYGAYALNMEAKETGSDCCSFRSPLDQSGLISGFELQSPHG